MQLILLVVSLAIVLGLRCEIFCDVYTVCFAFIGHVCELLRSSRAVGAVADLRRVKNAIAVAQCVLNFTKHTLLTGESGKFVKINF